ncbi:hypothetical protein LQ757_13905 [Agromyces sp. SYSU K20354]|uniref:hypothetical protein n=1 Tax=Agromyces cavernae TaxID=2898659 RepID=UPI001E65734F|nr:hypothetical protein [Agromyces cavernae]MCD2443372.1 hypothetical protein [Agromyces cavernae]
MDPLLKKLNVTDPVVRVFDAPNSFRDHVMAVDGVVLDETRAGIESAGWVLGFAQTQEQVDAFAESVASLTAGDAIVWIAYPKASSKRYRCEFNRDTGWFSMGAAGFEPVRQVAIDEDWSALRFRRIEFIKNLTRRFTAASEEGRRRQRGDA